MHWVLSLISCSKCIMASSVVIKEECDIKQDIDEHVKSEPDDFDDAGYLDTDNQHVAWEVVGEVHLSEAGTHLKAGDSVTQIGSDTQETDHVNVEPIDKVNHLLHAGSGTVNPLIHAGTGAVNNNGGCMHKGVKVEAVDNNEFEPVEFEVKTEVEVEPVEVEVKTGAEEECLEEMVVHNHVSATVASNPGSDDIFSNSNLIQLLHTGKLSSASAEEGEPLGIRISDIRSGETEVRAVVGELPLLENTAGKLLSARQPTSLVGNSCEKTVQPAAFPHGPAFVLACPSTFAALHSVTTLGIVSTGNLTVPTGTAFKDALSLNYQLPVVRYPEKVSAVIQMVRAARAAEKMSKRAKVKISDGDSSKTDKNLSQPLIYPHCSCQVSEAEMKEKKKGLEHLGVLWLMKEKIFTFTMYGKPFTFLMEYEMVNFLPKPPIVSSAFNRVAAIHGSEIRPAGTTEWTFMNMMYPNWATTLNTYVMVTPYFMHMLYKESSKDDAAWAPFCQALFYSQQYGHVCPWTLFVTPMAARENLHNLLSDLEKGRTAAKAVPRILASRRKVAKRSCCSADARLLTAEALKQLIETFSLQNIVEPFCSCELSIDDLMEPCRVSGAFHFQMTQMYFMGVGALHCWLRPYGMFLSVQELKVQGLLPWKKHIVEDLLTNGLEGERARLLDLESNILRPFASSLTGAISTYLVSVKFLRKIYQCLVDFEPAWASFISEKLYIKLREHDCPAQNINPGVHITRPKSGPGFVTMNPSQGGCEPSQDTCVIPRKRKRKENPIGAAASVVVTCSVSKSQNADSSDPLVGGSSSKGSDSEMAKKAQCMTVNPGSESTNKLSGSDFLTGRFTDKRKKMSFVLEIPESDGLDGIDEQDRILFSLKDFPHACSCIREPGPFPYFSILACATTVRNCDVLPINKHMGQAIIITPSSRPVFFTFTLKNRLFFSIAELQLKGIMTHDVDFDTVPSYGPSFWLRIAEDFELRCLKSRRVNTKVSTFGHYMISAELLCYLSKIESIVPAGFIEQNDICRLKLGHICSDRSSLAYDVQLEDHQENAGVNTTSAWAMEASAQNMFDPCPVVWPTHKDVAPTTTAIEPLPPEKTLASTELSLASVQVEPNDIRSNTAEASRNLSGQKGPRSSAAQSVLSNSVASSAACVICKPQIALRVLKGAATLETVNLNAIKRTHSDYYIAEKDSSLVDMINKVSQQEEVEHVENRLIKFQSAHMNDEECVAASLPMYEGKFVRKRILLGQTIPVATAEPQDISMELLQSSLGAGLRDYWLVLTGKLDYNGLPLTSIFVDNSLFINWTEFTTKYQFSSEIVYQLACTLKICVYRPPPDVRQHLLQFHSFHYYDSPWVTVKSLRAVYYLGLENEESQTFPKTFSFLRARFVDQRPVGSFSDFILIKKSR